MPIKVEHGPNLADYGTAIMWAGQEIERKKRQQQLMDFYMKMMMSNRLHSQKMDQIRTAGRYRGGGGGIIRRPSKRTPTVTGRGAPPSWDELMGYGTQKGEKKKGKGDVGGQAQRMQDAQRFFNMRNALEVQQAKMSRGKKGGFQANPYRRGGPGDYSILSKMEKMG